MHNCYLFIIIAYPDDFLMSMRNFIINANMMVEVNISIVDDDIAEPTESFTFSITLVDPGSIELSDNGPFTVTIPENDGKSASLTLLIDLSVFFFLHPRLSVDPHRNALATWVDLGSIARQQTNDPHDQFNPAPPPHYVPHSPHQREKVVGMI